ncbi:MAG: Na(+)-translocating NADH-quinone reductase subunit A [Bacteroidales bacterium]|nr:Na(+)-translocating NADH-quinone reductase subunit A [Bacteroidales bacterium]MBN2818491.1 Na(+)-translocating NADH-quinone reductase subunit A [Bacteroidales bacterium]
MSEVIKIKKGLDINLKGKAEKVYIKADPSKTYAVKPTDFTGVTPKLAVEAGATVKAGTPLFYNKYKPEIKFTSPVSGKVLEVNRGERRMILEIIVESDGKFESEDFKVSSPAEMNRESIVKTLLDSGLWPAIKQRPYSVIANPADTPKAIFISAFDSAPLGVDYDFILQDSAKEFQAGIDVLSKLTEGKIHVGVNGKYPVSPVIQNTKNIQINLFKGPHPAGNVGVQIHHIDPVNKGEVVWVVEPQKVVTIGRLFLTGKYNASKIVALGGSEVKKPRYYKVYEGTNISCLTDNNVNEGDLRFISGNALNGTRISQDGFLGFYDSLLTVIPEGNKYEFMGWIAPGFKKYSFSRTFFSWLMPNREYIIDSNLHGGRRALMITGKFEQVFPMDIYPMQLIKAIIIEDIDLMENLGIYEVAEEDFALCEFIDTSKTDIQSIVRKGLDIMIKEMS